MADSISNYSFDFAKEVAAIRLEHGRTVALASFVEVDVDPERDDKVEILHFIGNALLEQDVRNHLKSRYNEEPTLGSFRGAVDLSFGHFVSFVKNDDTPQICGEENTDALRLFTLYHETAHLLAPDDDKVHGENTADAYAAIRLLQRFGNEALPLLSMFSWFRAWGTLYNDMHHLSTLTLDRIITDAAHGSFSGLTPAQSMDYAVRYSGAATPSPRMLKGVRKAFKDIADDDKFTTDGAALILETGLKSKSQLARYLAAKFYNPFMHKSGIEFYDEQSDYDAKTQGHYQALIERKTGIDQIPQVARRLGLKPAGWLRRTFGKRAEKSAATVADSLRVSIPAGQERFTFAYG